MDHDHPANADPLLPESNSEASCSFTRRQRRDKPLKRIRMDDLHEDLEPQPEERPGKRRRSETEVKDVNREKAENDSVTSCYFTARQTMENSLKRKRTDDLHEDPEPQPEEKPGKRRRSETAVKDVNREKTENDSVASCYFTARQTVENSLKRKRTDEEPEVQPEEKPPKRRRTGTRGMGTQPIRRINPFRIAKLYGRYTLKDVLGRGAYGYVYEGFRKMDRKKVAFKFMQKKGNEEFITLPGDTRRLPLEVALLELVCKPPRCPYVIELLEWFDTPRAVVLVLERPDPCVDLWKYCRLQHNKVTEAQARIIMKQVIQAAHHCRDRGVFHRDIKEGNILLNPQTLEAKLIDFGCGDLLKDTPYRKFIGTRRYVPPEWFFGRNYEAEPTTVWGLGVLLYSLIHGEERYFRVEQAIAGGMSLTKDVSEACRSLMQWCLELDPQNRPTLEQILEHPWF